MPNTSVTKNEKLGMSNIRYIRMDNAMLEAIEAVRQEMGLHSHSEAARYLLKKALDDRARARQAAHYLE